MLFERLGTGIVYLLKNGDFGNYRNLKNLFFQDRRYYSNVLE
jgi:hypothetical protein